MAVEEKMTAIWWLCLPALRQVKRLEEIRVPVQHDLRLIVINMELGKTEFSLNVKSIGKSHEFYASLGFEKVEGAEDEGWIVLENAGFRIGLYQGHIPENALTFFGGDVAAIAKHLSRAGYEMASGPEKEEDGSLGATVKDPDGNVIYFNS